MRAENINVNKKEHETFCLEILKIALILKEFYKQKKICNHNYNETKPC